MNKSEQFTSVLSNNFGPTSQMTALGIFYGVLVLLVGYPPTPLQVWWFCVFRTCLLLFKDLPNVKARKALQPRLVIIFIVDGSTYQRMYRSIFSY